MTESPSKNRDDDRELAVDHATMLLKHARRGRRYDRIIQRALDYVGLYLYTGSMDVEKHETWDRASNAALNIRAKRDAGWKKRLTFEHPRPRLQMWQELVALGDAATIEDIVRIVGEYPYILITREENAMQTARGQRLNGDPEERYTGIDLSFQLKTRARHPLAFGAAKLSFRNR